MVLPNRMAGAPINRYLMQFTNNCLEGFFEWTSADRNSSRALSGLYLFPLLVESFLDYFLWDDKRQLSFDNEFWMKKFAKTHFKVNIRSSKNAYSASPCVQLNRFIRWWQRYRYGDDAQPLPVHQDQAFKFLIYKATNLEHRVVERIWTMKFGSNFPN